MTHDEIVSLAEKNHYVNQLVSVKLLFGREASIAIAGDVSERYHTVVDLFAEGFCGPEFAVIDRWLDNLRCPRREVWPFTKSELENPAGLRSDDVLVASVRSEEQGVIVYRNGLASNRWEDGTAGVPLMAQAEASEIESLYHPDAEEWTHEWRTVWVDHAGRFMRFHESSTH